MGVAVVGTVAFTARHKAAAGASSESESQGSLAEVGRYVSAIVVTKSE